MTCLLDLLFVMVFVALMVHDGNRESADTDKPLAKDDVTGVQSEEPNEKPSDLDNEVSNLNVEIERESLEAQRVAREAEEATFELAKRDKQIEDLEDRLNEADNKFQNARNQYSAAERKVGEQANEIERLGQKVLKDSQRLIPTAEDITLLGIWRQDAEVRGQWIEVGKFIVYKHRDGTLRMAAIAQGSNRDYTKGISDVQLASGNWTFKSDLARAGMAEFRLKRVREDVYEGASYLNGNLREKNRWTRIE